MHKIVARGLVGVLLALTLATPAVGTAQAAHVTSVNGAGRYQIKPSDVQPLSIEGQSKTDNTTLTVRIYTGRDASPASADLFTDCQDNSGIDSLTADPTNPQGSWDCMVQAVLPRGEYTIIVETTPTDGGATVQTSKNIDVLGKLFSPGTINVNSPGYGDPIVVSGTGGTPGGNIIVKIDGNVVDCAPVVAGDGTWTCTVNDLLEPGNHTVSVIAVDPEFPDSTSDPVNKTLTVGPSAFTVDTVSPSSVTPGKTVQVVGNYDMGLSGVSVSATLKNPSAVSVDTDSCTLDSPTTGKYTCSVTVPPGLATPTGTYTVRVDQNPGDQTGSKTFQVVAAVAPTAPTVTAFGATVPFASQPVTVTGTGKTAGTTITVTIDGTDTTCATPPTLASTGSWSCTITEVFAPGAHSVTATQTDSDSTLESIPSSSVTLTIGASAFAIAAEPSSVIAGSPITITGTVDQIAGTTVGAKVTDSGSFTSTGDCEITGSTFSCDFDPIAVPGTDYTVTAIQTSGSNSHKETRTRGLTVAPTAGTISDPGSVDYIDQPVTLTGSGATPGAEIVVLVDDQAATCQPVVAEDGTWSCTLDVLDPGAHDIDVSAVDPDDSNNISALVSTTVTIGTSAFTVGDVSPTLVNPGDTVHIVGTYDKGLADVGVAAVLTDPNDTEVDSATCTLDVPNSGDYVCELTIGDEPLGTYTITVTQSPGGRSGFKEFAVVAPVPPPVPTVDDATVAFADQPVTITGSDKVTRSTLTVKVDGTEVTCDPAPAASASGTWSCAISDVFSEGDHTLSVTATDTKNGLTSEADTATLTIGASAFAIDASPSSVVAGTIDPITITGTIDPITGTVVTATLTDSGSYSDTGDCSVDLEAATFSCEFDAIAVPGTDYTVTAVQTSGSNDHEETRFRSLAVVPTAGVVPDPGTVEFIAQPATITGSGATPGAVIVVTVDDVIVACDPPAVVAEDGTWSCTLPDVLGPGAHAITITAVDPDESGNTSAVLDRTITIGASALAITDVSPDLVNPGDPITVTGTYDNGLEGVAVTATLTSPADVDVDQATCTLDDPATGQFTCNLTTELGDPTGTYTVTVDQSPGTESRSTTFVVSAPVPPPALTVDAFGGTVPFVDQPVTVTGSGKVAGSTITVTIDGTDVTCDPAPAASDTGLWSCTITEILAPGAHSVVATATDTKNGLESDPSNTVSLTIGASAFAIDSAPASFAAGAAITITGTIDPITGTTVAATLNSNTGNCSVDLVAETFSCGFSPINTLGTNYTVQAVQTTGNHDETRTRGVAISPAPVNVVPPGTVEYVNQQIVLTGDGGTPGAVIVVTIDGQPIACDPPAIIASDGTWSCTLADILDPGAHDIVVTAVDPNDPTNTSPGSSSAVTLNPSRFRIVTAPNSVVAGEQFTVTGEYDAGLPGVTLGASITQTTRPVIALSATTTLAAAAFAPQPLAVSTYQCTVDSGAGTFSCSMLVDSITPPSTIDVSVNQTAGSSSLTDTKVLSLLAPISGGVTNPPVVVTPTTPGPTTPGPTTPGPTDTPPGDDTVAVGDLTEGGSQPEDLIDGLGNANLDITDIGISAGTAALLGLAIAGGVLFGMGGGRGLARNSASREAHAHEAHQAHEAHEEKPIFADRDDGDETRRAGVRDGEGLGDRSFTWRFPGHRLMDAASISVPLAIAPRSPLLARFTSDGSEARAIFGILWLFIPFVGAGLGAWAAIDTSGRPVPPALWLVVAITVLATFDAFSGVVATVVFCLAIFVSGGLWDSPAPDVMHSLLVLLALGFLWTTLPLVGSAIRPFRRPGSLDLTYTWDRGADLVIASLLCAWVAQKLAEAMEMFAGTETTMDGRADFFALVALGAIGARILTEQLSLILYPKRLKAVETVGELPPTMTLYALGGIVVRTAVFGFIGYAFIGNCWQWWLGMTLFTLPPLSVIVQNRFPTVKSVKMLLPEGLVEIFVLTIVVTLSVRYVTRNTTEEIDMLRAVYLLVALPPALFGLINLWAEPDESSNRTWVRELLGLGVLITTTYLAFQGWDY